MKKIACTVFLFCFLNVFGQDSTGLFVEAHYAGMSYLPKMNHRPAVSSGAGLAVGIEPRNRFLIELAYDNVFIEETSTGVASSTVLHTRGQIFSLRSGVVKTFPNSSVYGLLGVGTRFTERVEVKMPGMTVITNGIGSVSADLGVRYRGCIAPHWYITTSVFTNWMIPEKDESSYLTPEKLPFNSFVVIAGTMGITYKMEN